MSTAAPLSPPGVDAAGRERLVAAAARLRAEVSRRIVGQESVLDEILMGIVAGGHVLLVGVPGLAKTLMIRSIAEAMRLDFRRIQFTPDLVPSDITGTEILEEDQATGHRAFRFVRGPIFSNIVLADEINRASPKTQAALLEVMEEGRVTVDGVSRQVGVPFLVLATQNPVEQAGTYRLPEAQLDRFLMRTSLGYPDHAATVRILDGAAVATSDLPAVITVDLRLNEPRFVKLPDIMKAKRKPLDVIAFADLGVEAGPDLAISRYAPPPQRQRGIMVENAVQLVGELKKRGLL